MKTLTIIFANVRAVFVRAFIIKSALLETGHVSRSQAVCLVSKRYNTIDIFNDLQTINIDRDEKKILEYIGGYLIMKAVKKYSMHTSFLSKLQNQEGNPSTNLIKLPEKNSGALCIPMDSFRYFFDLYLLCHPRRMRQKFEKTLGKHDH